MVISLQHATTQIHDLWLEYWSSPHGRNEPEGFLRALGAALLES
jgi:hypothetical protein